jgi:hypothetical protein
VLRSPVAGLLISKYLHGIKAHGSIRRAHTGRRAHEDGVGIEGVHIAPTEESFATG